MRFIFKIWSGYDGFTPSQIPNRLTSGDRLKLRWDRYIDQVEIGDEVWVYFHGPHKFANGVYIKGKVRDVDLQNRAVTLNVRRYKASIPLTVSETAEQIADLVKARGIQAFLVPEEWQPTPECTALTTAETCSQRRCEWCPVWERGFPRAKSYNPPERLGSEVSGYFAGYWAIPRRCFWSKAAIKPGIRKTTELFSSFKIGQAALAYPLSLGLYDALRDAEALKFDAIVPVPLSPDKQARGELDRTHGLGKELSRFLGVPVRRALSLSKPISKRVFLNRGGTVTQFERAYADALNVSRPPKGMILLVDDVGTRGSTLGTCTHALLENGGDRKVVAANAALMLTKHAVTNAREVLVQGPG